MSYLCASMAEKKCMLYCLTYIINTDRHTTWIRWTEKYNWFWSNRPHNESPASASTHRRTCAQSICVSLTHSSCTCLCHVVFIHFKNVSPKVSHIHPTVRPTPFKSIHSPRPYRGFYSNYSRSMHTRTSPSSTLASLHPSPQLNYLYVVNSAWVVFRGLVAFQFVCKAEAGIWKRRQTLQCNTIDSFLFGYKKGR